MNNPLAARDAKRMLDKPEHEHDMRKLAASEQAAASRMTNPPVVPDTEKVEQCEGDCGNVFCPAVARAVPDTAAPEIDSHECPRCGKEVPGDDAHTCAAAYPSEKARQLMRALERATNSDEDYRDESVALLSYMGETEKERDELAQHRHIWDGSIKGAWAHLAEVQSQLAAANERLRQYEGKGEPSNDS